MTEISTTIEHEQQQQNNDMKMTINTSTPQSTQSLIRFIECLNTEFERAHNSCTDEKTVDENHIKQLFKQYVNNSNDNHSFQLKDMMNYCYYDPESSYTRNLIYENNDFSLMMLVWNPNASSCIHSHGGSQCWLRVLHGHVNEVFYHVDPNDDSTRTQLDEENMPITIHSAQVNDICYIDDLRGMHRIENLDQLSVTLHCYAPPYSRCKCYDKNGRAIVGSVSFDTEFGVVKSQSKTLVQVDYSSMLSSSQASSSSTETNNGCGQPVFH